MITKPIISNNFSVDDIHKIREWHFEMRKEMGTENYSKLLTEKVKNLLVDFPKAKLYRLTD